MPAAADLEIHQETSPIVRARSRRYGTRRSFIAVLSGLAAFTALQLSWSAVVEMGMPEVRDPLYGRRLRLVQKALRDEPAKPRTVIMLGTSRTLADFRPSASDNRWGDPTDRPIAPFNFGVAGCGHMTELLMWRRLRQDGVRPDLLLVEVMPVLLCSQHYFGDFAADHWPTMSLRWRDVALVKQYAAADRPGLRGDWLKAFALPSYSQRNSITKLFTPDLSVKVPGLEDQWNVDQFGSLPALKTPTPADRCRFREMTCEGYKPFLQGFRLGGSQCQALGELMALCHKEGIPAALVFMPEGPAFRSWYSPETLRDIQEWVEQLGRENAAPVIDARAWMDEDDFRDSNHLLSGAAARFTERFKREAILPLMQRLADEEKSPRR